MNDIKYFFLCFLGNWKIKKEFYLLTLFTLLLFQSSCKKAVEVSAPDTGLVGSTVYAQNSTAEAAVSYIFINASNLNVVNFLSCRAGLYADELVNYNSDPYDGQFYSNTLNSTLGTTFWAQDYQQIYLTNAAIEGLTASSTLTPAIKQQLLGEAKFMRAFYYFYLTNLYGEVPLALTTDYRINNQIERSPQDDVYKQIISDLVDAQNLLSDDYKNPDGSVATERVRPNKGTATGLLARAYLYRSSWENARKQATALIESQSYKLERDLDSTFLTSSKEAIWQLLNTDNSGYGPVAGRLFIMDAIPGSTYNDYTLSSFMYNNFQPGDNRFNKWVGIFKDPNSNTDYYYAYKYKQKYEVLAAANQYETVFRLAEQYLIRAEANIELGDIPSGIADLNILRKRARAAATGTVTNPLPDLSISLSKTDALAALLKERQVELFTEWGHRWFDLKRTGNLNSVMQTVTSTKGGTWSPDWALFPVPLSDIKANPNLTQNKGYNK